ncbi:MAG: aminotransferase, partial [Alphaproteobacteria bacterium]|nr:aminotransferase [Alphaproteobacteria bacterium]
EAGWKVENPKASMFIWAELPEAFKEMGSLDFSLQMLEKADVAVAPGIGFGEYGDTHVRIALVENKHRIRQAVRNIKDFLAAGPDAKPKTRKKKAAA